MEKNSIYTLNEFEGINVSTDVSKIKDNESPDMCNFELDIKGSLRKRLGYKKVFESLGSGPINGQFIYKKKDNTSVELFTHQTKLYSLVNDMPTIIYDGLANSKTIFFVVKDKLYILDGESYLEYDGKTVKEPTPYIPEMFHNTMAMEDFNLLGTRFKCTFSPKADEKEFALGVKKLNSEEVKVSTDGGVTWRTTGFTVDRDKGIVMMDVAPGDGDSTLVIEAAKDNSGKKEFIKKCTLQTIYGGTNDTRIILSGNPNFPNRIFRSGLYDPSYFPENGFTDLGGDNDKIQGLVKQYDGLVVIKEMSVFMVNYDSTQLIFTSKPINDESGTCAKNSIQIINNSPVWLDRYKGVMLLRQSNVRDERNCKIISDKINNLLLQEEGLEFSTSVDYQGKYHLFVNGNVYVYDYNRDLWWKFDNIHANTFLIKDTLTFGDMNGCIQRFKKIEENFAYNDNDDPINAYWYSKLMNFNADYREKTVRKIYYCIRPADRSSISLYVNTDNFKDQFLAFGRVNLFRFSPFYFEPFSFIGNSLPLTEGIKAKLKKIVFLQVKVVNDRFDESLGLISLNFEIQKTRYVK
ncbi:hypothetical protein [Clostridium sp. LP20]|uniref:hypothetical protein n=1 Tax=Clostridium sp. LP20 TaxID=3418665 RepID=UPI003EE45E1F